MNVSYHNVHLDTICHNIYIYILCVAIDISFHESLKPGSVATLPTWSMANLGWISDSPIDRLSVFPDTSPLFAEIW